LGALKVAITPQRSSSEMGEEEKTTADGLKGSLSSDNQRNTIPDIGVRTKLHF